MKRILLTILFMLFYLSIAGEEDIKLDIIPEVKVEKKEEVVLEYSYLEEKVTATVYNAVKEQCDEDFLHTADGSFIEVENIDSLHWIAVSQDLLKKGFKYGDTVEIISEYKSINGVYYIHDCMNKRYTNYIDFLVPNNITKGKWNNVKIRKRI